MMSSGSAHVPVRDLTTISEEIKAIHGLCKKWSTQTVNASTARPKGLRWLKVSYGLASMVALLGYLLILSQIHWESAGWMKFHLRFVQTIFGLWLVYAAAAISVDAFFGWREMRDSASAFSREDEENLEAELKHCVELARFHPSILHLVASWLEVQAKRIENQLNWLKGSAGMAVAILAATFLDRSPLRDKLAELFALPGIIVAQLVVFSALLGILLGIVVVGRCASNSSNRALHLRRILTEQGTLLEMDNMKPDGLVRPDSEGGK